MWACDGDTEWVRAEGPTSLVFVETVSPEFIRSFAPTCDCVRAWMNLVWLILSCLSLCCYERPVMSFTVSMWLSIEQCNLVTNNKGFVRFCDGVSANTSLLPSMYNINIRVVWLRHSGTVNQPHTTRGWPIEPQEDLASEGPHCIQVNTTSQHHHVTGAYHELWSGKLHLQPCKDFSKPHTQHGIVCVIRASWDTVH